MITRIIASVKWYGTALPNHDCQPDTWLKRFAWSDLDRGGKMQWIDQPAGMTDDRSPRAVVSVEGAVKSYGSLKALDSVDLQVATSEFVALLGLNGAGKTTLFQLLTGLFMPDSGAIIVNGSEMRRDPMSALKGLGIVFQESTLDLDLPVSSSLYFHAGLHGMSRARAKVRMVEELGRLGLSDSIGTIGRKLSGGNRRRVELARALMHDPRILLLDEPTVGLDPAVRRDLLNYVVQMCKERGLSVLWATHLVEEAERADRVVILHRGRVVESAPPAALMDRAGTKTLSDAFLSLIDGGRVHTTGAA
jgi:ABC-2 type transport system ATP-binding protein